MRCGDLLSYNIAAIHGRRCAYGAIEKFTVCPLVRESGALRDQPMQRVPCSFLFSSGMYLDLTIFLERSSFPKTRCIAEMDMHEQQDQDLLPYPDPRVCEIVAFLVEIFLLWGPLTNFAPTPPAFQGKCHDPAEPPSVESMFLQSFGWQWTPLLDTLKVSKNKRDRFWPVGVVTGKLLAATLKGGEEHPAAYPRPVLTGGCPFAAAAAACWCRCRRHCCCRLSMFLFSCVSSFCFLLPSRRHTTISFFF